MPNASRSTTVERLVSDARTLASLRVLIADAHPHFRAALRAFLHTHRRVWVVAEAATAATAVAIAADTPADVAFVDLALCLETDLIRRLKHLNPGQRVVAASIADDAEYARRALRLGADAWVAKDDLERISATILEPLGGDGF